MQKEQKMIEEKNAIIRDTMLGFEDHGIFTCFIYLDYEGSGQGFGGYSIGDEFIKEVLKTLEIDNWEDLKGERIRVRAEESKVHSIGHYLKDKWFTPEEFYKKKK